MPQIFAPTNLCGAVCMKELNCTKVNPMPLKVDEKKKRAFSRISMYIYFGTDLVCARLTGEL